MVAVACLCLRGPGIGMLFKFIDVVYNGNFMYVFMYYIHIESDDHQFKVAKRFEAIIFTRE